MPKSVYSYNHYRQRASWDGKVADDSDYGNKVYPSKLAHVCKLMWFWYTPKYVKICIVFVLASIMFYLCHMGSPIVS